jgi:alpha-glucosidase (family GH31 glycosyl hydrolase)
VPTLYTAEQVLHEVDEFRTRGYPLAVVGLEPGWQSAAYPGTFVWDRTRFPDPPGFMREMTRRGIRVNLWLNPYVAPSAPFYERLVPLSGSHTVWTGIVPDFMMPAARTVVLDLFQQEHLRLGVSGYKIDEVDGYDRWLWPDDAVFPSGLSGEEMRQVYGLALQRATADLFHGRNQRTWGLVRASNAGAASLPYVIYNDYYSHPDFITALVNSGFIGVLWTPEVRASKTGEEWVRRMQSVCFSPLAMLNAWADGTKPWSFPDVADAVRDVMRLRVRLLPYLYTAFARYHFEGTPPFRAMALVDGFSGPRDMKDQFMVGDELLVAPMFAGDTARSVILPSGRWYDFYTGALVGAGAGAGAGETITVKPGLDRIPLFVRDGGIIPLLASDSASLEVRHYGDAVGHFSLYDDDGVTFGYERGDFSWTALTVERDRAGKLRGAVRRPPKGKPFAYRTIQWRMMSGS